MTPQQPLLVFNTSILTGDGNYTLRTITLEGARALASVAELDSAIGHDSVAAILTELLGVEVPVNRQQAVQQPGQHALVIKLRGRAPEGKILDREEIEAIGYDLKLLTRAPEDAPEEVQWAQEILRRPGYFDGDRDMADLCGVAAALKREVDRLSALTAEARAGQD